MNWIKKLIEYFKNAISGDNRKKIIENTVIVIIIGIIIIIAGSSLFKKEKITNTDPGSSGDINTKEVGKAVTTDEREDMEKKVEYILSKIKGAGEVNVMITFVSGEEMVPAYDTKRDENETQEKDSGGGTRSIKESSYEDSMVYQEEQGGGKKPVILKKVQPDVKGVVIAADGAADEEVKENLSRAVQALLDVPLHRIQVFERNR